MVLIFLNKNMPRISNKKERGRVYPSSFITPDHEEKLTLLYQNWYCLTETKDCAVQIVVSTIL